MLWSTKWLSYRDHRLCDVILHPMYFGDGMATGSDIAEGPRDASCRSISCQILRAQQYAKSHFRRLAICSYMYTARSADILTCLVTRTLSSYGDRTFAAAGPRLWNSLPVQLRNPDITYGLFRRQLKAQLMPLPLTVSCFSKIQTGFAFLVAAHLGIPGKKAVKRVCVCVPYLLTYLVG